MTIATTRRSVLRRSLHALKIRPRLITAFAVGIVVGLLLPESFRGQSRLLVGWDVGVALYLASTWHMMMQSDVHELRQRAARHDEGEWAIILLSMGATLASLIAIGAELLQAGASDPFRIWRASITAGTILMSWLFVHTIMTLHYAHDYYLREGPGLNFPDHIEEPDYWDFAYFAFTIGVAAQTADVAIASQRIRRVALAHSVLAFFFNTAILALAINVGASLL